MNGFDQYMALTISTAVVVFLTVVVWWRTRQLAFVLGFAFLYYWSLYGAWSVIARGTGAVGEYRFEYLYHKLFPIYLDEYYVWTILLYALFVATVQVTVLFIANPRPLPDLEGNQIHLDHRVLIVIGSVLALGAFLIVKDVLVTAATLHVGAYSVIGAVQAGADPTMKLPLFTLYQVLNEAALGCLTLGVAVLLSGSNAKYVIARPRRWPIIGYIIVLSALFSLNLLLGNRSMLVFAILPSGLLYLANARRRSITVLVVCGVLGATAIILPGIMRSAAAMREMNGLSLPERAQYAISQTLGQKTESFAAHASMYGALSRHISLTYGSSLLWLAGSVIPRIVHPNSAQIIYDHYAEGVGAASNQGFTIHHATGWYLNFGVPGIFIGAMLFGGIWAALMNRLHNISKYRSHVARVFSIIGIWNFTAFIPTLLRGGPEGYKGLTVEALLLPTFIVTIASMRLVMRNNRPWFIPANLGWASAPSAEVSRLRFSSR